MPYLTRVGPNRGNEGGAESRGYRVFRRGVLVRSVWGPIEPIRGRGVSFVWSRRTLFKEFEEHSPADAAKRVQSIVRDREREGYQKLPPGCRIGPPELARGVTERE